MTNDIQNSTKVNSNQTKFSKFFLTLTIKKSLFVYSNILASLPIGATNLNVESEHLGSFGLSAHAKGFFSCSFFVQNQAINTTGFEDGVIFSIN